MDILEPVILSFMESLSTLQVKMYWYNREVTSKCVLYSEGFFIGILCLECPSLEVLLYIVSTVVPGIVGVATQRTSQGR